MRVSPEADGEDGKTYFAGAVFSLSLSLCEILY